MPIIKLRTYSPILAKLHGKKPSKIDRLIMLRSEETHTEIQFSESYGGVSASATMQDDCKCFRFKMIGYTHPERWLTVCIEVTEEQEDLIFAKCCEMADVGCLKGQGSWLDLTGDIERGDCEDMCYFGPKALKYDLAGVSFSFITPWIIWQPSKKRVFCTEACFIALLEAFPDLLTFPSKNIKADGLTPSLGFKIAYSYFRKK